MAEIIINCCAIASISVRQMEPNVYNTLKIENVFTEFTLFKCLLRYIAQFISKLEIYLLE